MLNISVIGSVGTRKTLDLFEVSTFCVKRYLPKISLGTAFSAPINVDPIGIEEVNGDFFIKGIVDFDFSGGSSLLNDDLDVILIDFFDDIYPIAVDGQVSVTLSDYFSRYPKLSEKISSMESFGGFSNEKLELIKKSLSKLSVFSRENEIDVYIVESYYSNKGGDEFIDNINVWLTKIYKVVKKLPNIKLIKLNKTSYNLFNKANHIEPGSTQAYQSNLAAILAAELNIKNNYVGTVEETIRNIIDDFSSAVYMKALPSIFDLYTMANDFKSRGELILSDSTSRLIKLLHNSSVPLSVSLGRGVSFGYGGIGVIIHEDAVIYDYVKIGSNVTVGGGRSQIINGTLKRVPVIGSRVYIATGAKILGGVEVGHHSIVGANAVVITSVPPYSIVAGNPAKVVATITVDNISKYASYLYKGLDLATVKHLAFTH